MNKYLILIFSLIILNSCQKAKENGQELIVKSTDKVKSKGKVLWKSMFEKTISTLTTTREITFQEVFKKADSLNVKESNGILIESPGGFYSGFLKYQADDKAILNFIANQSTVIPDISNVTFSKIDSIELYEKLDFIEQKFPDIKKQLDFFYEIKEKQNLIFYKFNKYPNSNIIVVDASNGTLYHFYEKYWD